MPKELNEEKQNKSSLKASYVTAPFHYYTADLKGQTRYYVEGFVSTIDPDLKNEVVTMEAQRDILSDINGHVITMDLDHEEWFQLAGGVKNPRNNEENQLDQPKGKSLPIAKIVDAELRTRGVWVKAEINKNLPDFKAIWNSIKDGFLHSFSIATYNLKTIQKNIDGMVYTFIDSLRLANVAITGSPVNPGATFKPVMKALLKSEVSNMDEEQAKEQTDQEEKVEDNQESKEDKTEEKQEEKKEEQKQESNEVEEIKKKLEEENNKLKEEKEQLEKQTKELQEKLDNSTKQVEEVKKAVEGPLASIKSLRESNDALKKKVGDLKSQLAKPVLKARQEDAPKTELQEALNPLDQIK
jgi:hypothetical protein